MKSKHIYRKNLYSLQVSFLDGRYFQEWFDNQVPLIGREEFLLVYPENINNFFYRVIFSPVIRIPIIIFVHLEE